MPSWLRREIGVERSLKHFARHAASAIRDDSSENDVAAPTREITSRHGVDERSLLLLAVRRDALILRDLRCCHARKRRASGSLQTECLAFKASDVDGRPSRVSANSLIEELTSQSIPTSYEYDCFTPMVTEFKRGGWAEPALKFRTNFNIAGAPMAELDAASIKIERYADWQGGFA